MHRPGLLLNDPLLVRKHVWLCSLLRVLSCVFCCFCFCCRWQFFVFVPAVVLGWFGVGDIVFVGVVVGLVAVVVLLAATFSL